MKIALAMIVKGSPDEAEVLGRCLLNMNGYVDGIFITATYKKSVKETEEVVAMAEKFGATVSTFEWQYDFSKARNFNFSQVPKTFDYIMWSDADDMWRGLEDLKPTIKAHPHIDGFAFWYLYDWDEFKKPVVVHKKTMIVKNDDSVHWVGAIHEDLEPDRQYEVFLIEGIDRLHLTTKERFGEAAKRNVEISKREADAKPEDPRSYWNLANSQFGIANYQASIESFEKFLEMSESEEEKYLAYCRLADIQKSLGNSSSAIRNLQIAIGIQPALSDAYFQLGALYYGINDFDKSEEYLLRGLVLPPAISKMIVFNPRDYDYNPMMLLAKVYYQKSRPDLMLPLLEGCLKIYPKDEHLKQMVKDGREEKEKLRDALEAVERLRKVRGKEKLRAELDKLPLEVRSHPSVVMLRNKNFVKLVSAGNDLVIYCGNTAAQWNPELFKKKGFGGSEEAVIHMASELARLGWNVTVYNNCGHTPVYMKYGGGWEVTYRPFWEWNYRDKQDVVILWRWAKPLDADINAPKVFLDLHDVIQTGEFTEKRLQRLSKVFVKSKFHRSLFPNVPDNKIAVIPNGMELYAPDKPAKRDPYLVINTSSPDRSMDAMVPIWGLVKQAMPKAKMQWAYGWDNFKAFYGGDKKKMQWMHDTIKAMDEVGIETLGRLPQHEVAKLYQKATVFAYPTEFAEIDCISVKKAQAAGDIAITTDFAALKESNRFGQTLHSPKNKDTWSKPYQYHFGLEGDAAHEMFAQMIVSALKDGELMQTNQGEVKKWADALTWPNIASRWDAIIRA